MKGSHGLRAVAVHWAEERALCAGEEGQLTLWDLRSSVALCEVKGHEKLIWCLSADFASGYFASCAFDGTVKLWQIQEDTLEEISAMPRKHQESYMTMSLIPCGAAACQLLNSMQP